MTKRILPVLLLILVAIGRMTAQRAAGVNSNIDPLYLIDMPVAGILPTTSGSIDAFFYDQGGVLGGVVYGLRKNLNIGLFYGGTNIIGSGGITWDKLPGLMVRYRIFEEDAQYPALIVGFDSHGREGYSYSDHQYMTKSPGLFVAASKNYALAGSITFHGGLNYTLERYDKDMSPNMYMGVEKTLGPIVSVLGEYNFAFDNDQGRKGFWNGSLNFGVRIATNIGFNIDLLIKNLLTSNPYYHHPIRAVRIQYVRYL
jgi:hypothetical protein